MAYSSSVSKNLSAGGTISGHLTIEGDLTVTGAGAGYAYSEVLTGDMKITNTAASTAFEVEQNTGNGTAVLIDQNHATALGLYVDAETTTGTSIELNSNVLTTGTGTLITSNSNNTGAFKVCHIRNDHVDATGATALYVQQDSTGKSIFVDQNISSTTAGTYTSAHIDVDRTGTVSTGTDVITGLDLDVDTTGASGGTITSTGINIAVTGDGGGTSKAVGLDVTVASADTNYAALFNGGNVGIGTADPTSDLDIGDSGGGDLTLSRTGDANIVDGNNLGAIYFKGHDDSGSNVQPATGAKIVGQSVGTWDQDDVDDAPTELQFWTCSASGAISIAQRMVIDPDGNVGIGVVPETSHASYTTLPSGSITIL